MNEPYESLPLVPGGPILCILQLWEQGLDKVGLLGLINMSHFGRLNEANSYAKKLLACYHGGTLWLDTPVIVTVDLISDIMGFTKYGLEPS